MKKWYRNTIVKAILIGTVIAASIFASLSGVLLIGYQGEGVVTSESILQFQKGAYKDSEAFANRMRQVMYMVLDEMQASLQLETSDGKYDPKRLVDVMEYDESHTISGKNQSGLAYTLKELTEWGEAYDSGDMGMSDIVVCEKPDGTYYYYYLDDFMAVLKEKKLQVNMPYPEEEETHSYEAWLDEIWNVLKQGFYPDMYWGENLLIQDAEGKVIYKSFWPFQQGIQEKYAPEGAENILEVVNKTPELNGKLEEVFSALSNTVSSVAETVEMYQQNGDRWAEGNTNLQYLVANTASKKVYTNISEYEDYANVEKNIEKIKSIGKFVVVKDKLADFETNMDVAASEWSDMLKGYFPQEDKAEGQYILAAAVDTTFPVQDVFYTGEKEYGKYAPYLQNAGIVLIISVILLIVSFVWLTVCAGRRPEDEELHLNGFDRLKTILGAAIVFIPWIFLTFFVGSMWSEFGYQPMPYVDSNFYKGYIIYEFSISASDAMVLSFYVGMTMVLFLIGYLSLVRRIKGRTLWKNSVLRWVCGVFGEFWKHRSVCWRTVLLIAGFVGMHWLAFMFVSVGIALYLILLLAADGAALYFGIRKAIEKDRIRRGIKEIASGNVHYQIPLEKMHGESREMAELVNSIGDGLNNAVASAMKSERLKTDLITNVSHDIKTPLTSIINYVDLLKRENLQDPKIQGYLDVLEAKAQRLKTLTEDVVEASKVSSGNISLEMMDVNLVEMVNQTIGEFSEKMEAKKLTIVASLPEEQAIVHVDGRRMWRVLENIFNNAAKYAMPGTRVYADLRVNEGKVSFSLKNVSENPLNINAEELTERFIRGDVSRSTEGSGLGLSIARDLTEMQGGKFNLYVDGDLFKVMIEF